MIKELVLFSALSFFLGVLSLLLGQYIFNKFEIISKKNLLSNNFLNKSSIAIFFLMTVILYAAIMAAIYIFFIKSYISNEIYPIFKICVIAGLYLSIIASKYYQDKNLKKHDQQQSTQ